MTETLFQWIGTDRSGNKTQGEMAGQSPTLVKAALRLQGIRPIRVRKKPKALFGERKARILSKDITVFSRQLATMISSGVPLAQGLDIIAAGADNLQLRKLLTKTQTKHT